MKLAIVGFAFIASVVTCDLLDYCVLFGKSLVSPSFRIRDVFFKLRLFWLEVWLDHICCICAVFNRADTGKDTFTSNSWGLRLTRRNLCRSYGEFVSLVWPL
jgi:hypothetical protein